MIKAVTPKDNGDVWWGDLSNFWVWSPEVLERHLDMYGFRVQEVTEYVDRRTYLCVKFANPDRIYCA
jgi:hypothetical protein